MFIFLVGAALLMARFNLLLLCHAFLLCCDAMLNSPVACCTMLISCMQTCRVRKARLSESVALPGCHVQKRSLLMLADSMPHQSISRPCKPCNAEGTLAGPSEARTLRATGLVGSKASALLR